MTTWLTANCVPVPAGTWTAGAPAKTEEAAPEPGIQAPSSRTQGRWNGREPTSEQAKVMVLWTLPNLAGE
ncbi:hypothetical protein CEP54_014205 [Fusarium duplospermum]|uniref:Uncharacterized protein n=1 Tax=Fusarium duplospermum TaxID=1325734 RepID=A0A428NY51_9HYPO|nr:hypothetical protein CEP54_014205 [Fusarium duplospermum]